MVVEYTEDRMVDLWKLMKGYEPLVGEGLSVQRNDGVALDTLIRTRVRGWYLDLLRNGQIEMLAVDDCLRRVTLSPLGDGIWSLDLPESVVRVVEIMLPGERVCLVDEGSPSAKLLRSSSWRGLGAIGVVRRGNVTIYTPKTCRSLTLNAVKVVEEPPRGTYRFDELALTTLTQNFDDDDEC